MKTWKESFEEWQTICSNVRARANAVDHSVQNRGWQLAATVGIPRCGCSLHNASIDDSMSGWCKGNPIRLKVAKRANHLVNHWKANRIADRIIKRAWNRLLGAHGCATYSEREISL